MLFGDSYSYDVVFGKVVDFFALCDSYCTFRVAYRSWLLSRNQRRQS